MIFDLIASEYGYSFEDIRNMTMREIDIAMKYIGIRKHNEIAVNGKIHGLDMPFKETPMDKDEVVFSPEQKEYLDQIVDNGMKAIQERKQKRAR